MERRLKVLYLLGRILAFSELHPAEEEYESWKEAVFDAVYADDDQSLSKEDYPLFVARDKKVLRYMPREVLGENVDWERVCLGYLTPKQKRSAKKYYKEIKTKPAKKP